MLIDAYIWGFLHCSFKNKTNGKTIKKDPEPRKYPQLKVIYSCSASVLIVANFMAYLGTAARIPSPSIRGKKVSKSRGDGSTKEYRALTYEPIVARRGIRIN